MIAIEAPEPTTAETNEAISTSFRRIPSDPLAVGCETLACLKQYSHGGVPTRAARVGC